MPERKRAAAGSTLSWVVKVAGVTVAIVTSLAGPSRPAFAEPTFEVVKSSNCYPRA